MVRPSHTRTSTNSTQIINTYRDRFPDDYLDWIVNDMLFVMNEFQPYLNNITDHLRNTLRRNDIAMSGMQFSMHSNELTDQLGNGVVDHYWNIMDENDRDIFMNTYIHNNGVDNEYGSNDSNHANE